MNEVSFDSELDWVLILARFARMLTTLLRSSANRRLRFSQLRLMTT